MVRLLKKIVVSLVLVWIGMALMGASCNKDIGYLADHPDSLSIGDTMEVIIADAFTNFYSDSTIPDTPSRDSLHLGVGIPQGWSVVEAAVYPALHYRVAALMDSTEDSVALIQALQDSMYHFKAQKQPMTADSAMAAFFSWRTFEASWNNGDSTTDIQSQDIDQWSTWSCSLGISLNMNDKYDNFWVTHDTVTVDSIDTLVEGLTIIPVYLYLTLAPSQTPGNYDLFYYIKSDSLEEETAYTTNASNDNGYMLAKPVFLTDHSSIKWAGLSPNPKASSIRIYPNPVNATARFSLRTSATERPMKATICDVRGRLVKSFDYHPGRGQVPVWNWQGCDRRGRKVNAGTYIFSVGTEQGRISRTFELVR